MDLEHFADSIVIKKIDCSNFSASIQIPGELRVFEGHFPGKPILPGIACICIAEKLTSKFAGRDLGLKQLKKTKFFSPILPGASLLISGNVSCDDADGKTVNSQITFCDDKMQRVCLVKMIMESIIL